MGKTNEHLKTLSRLSEKIMALGAAIKKAEKDMQSVWMDPIEEIDLRDVKDRVKEVENAVHLLQKEVSHMGVEHCRGSKSRQQK